MTNANRNWSFAAKCAACDRTAATIRLIYDDETLTKPDEVLLIFSSLMVQATGWKITLEWAERIKASFAPPHDDFTRIRLADFADDAGFCGSCLKFYCWSHWNVLSSGVGWCPELHVKTIDPYCAYEA